MVVKYFIKTFGCQQNHADSERIARTYKARNFTKAKSYQEADHVIINTCMVRQSAENRVYGLLNNLAKWKNLSPKGGSPLSGRKIIVTGCMVGGAYRDKSGKFLKRLHKILPQVDEFMPIEEVGFDHQPLRIDKKSAWVPISNGCNNFCSYCIVPFTRGREVSRPFEEIVKECEELKKKGYEKVTLLGQNVNSYGADLKKSQLKPVYVLHLGRYRLPTLFPHLLAAVAKLGFQTVDFVSSNPWDFSNELINTIAKYPNITRTIHLPVQSGDSALLKKMNRWYSAQQYLALVAKIKKKIKGVRFTTDIIVGFCGETEAQFENTIKLCQKVDFLGAFISMYSERPFTAATKAMADDVPYAVKKKRWMRLDTLVNKYIH